MGRSLGTLPGLAAGAWLAAACAVSAQATVGRIAGVVRDPAGVPQPGVLVRVTDTQTGFWQTEPTDVQGRYAFVNLPLGDYTVSVEGQGFETGVTFGCVLVPDGRIVADFSLEARSSTGSLRSVPGPLGTISDAMSRTVNREQVENLPVNGRSSLQLVTLVAGTPQPTTDALEVMTGLGIDTSIDGSRLNANLLTVDGGFNMDSGSNNSQISSVALDFVDQVSIKASSLPAGYRRNSGAAVDVVTRSGTNRIKGSAFEYLRRDALDANDYFNNLGGVAKRPLAYDNFGGSIGGPVVKNKWFFFGGVEWKRVRRGTSPAIRSIPNSAMRRGDFSAISTTLTNPYTGQPFAGNLIPANLITADGRAIANVYAAMAGKAVAYDDGRARDNALFQSSSPFDFRQEMLRVDIRPSRAHRLGARLVFEHSTSIAPFGTSINSQLPTIPTERSRPSRNVQVHHNWTAGSLVNEATVDYSGNGQTIRPVGDGWKRETYGFTFPQLYGGGRYESSIPNVEVGSVASFRGANGALYSPTWDYSLSDNMTWLKGAHTLEVGGLFVYNKKDQNGRSDYAGTVTFATTGNTMTTGNAFADALLGNFRTYEEAQLDPMGYFRYYQLGAYVSDDWRLKDGLSIEAGVRYAWQMPTIALGNNTTSFDRALYNPANAVVINTNGTIVAGTGNRYNGLTRPGDVPSDQAANVPGGDGALVKSIPIASSRGYYQNQNLWAPRVSLDWKPSSKGSTVVRGGVGLSHDRPEGNLSFPLLNNPPFVHSANYENGNLSNPGGGTAAALAPWGTIQSVAPNLSVPRQLSWSVSVQRELPWYSLSGEVAYVGNRGVRLLRRPDINAPTFEDLARNISLRYSTDYWRPFKGYSIIQMYVSDGRSDYRALQLHVRRHRGTVDFTVNYTLSRSNDTASSNADGVDPGAADQDYYYGPSGYDRRHVLVASWTYRLPSFGTGGRTAEALFGGWEISGICRYQSGAPVTITGGTGIGTRRADYLGGNPYVYSVNAVTGVVTWLDPAKFSAAPDTRLGNSGRNQFVGPSYRAWDLSLRKSFRVHGATRLQFQADLFNALNQVNWNNPASNLTGSTPFGTITSAAPPRNVQLGVRLTF
jgi:hypothetical protein